MRGKGGKRRVVGCDPDTLKELKQWIELEPANRVLLFVSHRGNKLDTSYLRKLAKRHGERAKIRKRVHVHGFRHSGACFLADAGVDIRMISKQLGHSSLAVTDRYLDHLGATEVVEAVQSIRW
jgi:integrase/recombinase XerD